MSGFDFFPPFAASLKIALVASVIVFILAAAAAKWMSKARFPGKDIVDTLLMLPLVLPPTVVGFVLLVVFGRRSFVGEWFELLFRQTIVFTWGGAVIAAVTVAFPLAYRTIKSGFEAVDAHLEDSARSAGANEWQVVRFISAPLAYRALAAGYMLGFARGLGEFGATLMIAGNIPGRTQTIPTAIYMAVDGGDMTLAWAWTASIAAISFLMLAAVNRFSRDNR
jgi:molybdate transport system permease protein